MAEIQDAIYLENAAAETAPADFDALQTAVFTTGYLSDYQALISGVNDATDIAGMITALTALEKVRNLPMRILMKL